MPIIQAILLSLFISGLIVSLILGYFETWLFKIKELFQYLKAKIRLKKLKNLGYFELSPKNKLEYSQKMFFQWMKQGYGIKQLWGFEEGDLEFDYRSFLIDDYYEKEGIEMNWLKWTETLKAIGLIFNIENIKENPGDEDIESQEININGNQYLIIRDFNDEDMEEKSFGKFCEIVNKELKRINSRERIQLYGEHPTRVLILNQELKNYLFEYKNNR